MSIWQQILIATPPVIAILGALTAIFSKLMTLGRQFSDMADVVKDIPEKMQGLRDADKEMDYRVRALESALLNRDQRRRW